MEGRLSEAGHSEDIMDIASRSFEKEIGNWKGSSLYQQERETVNASL